MFEAQVRQAFRRLLVEHGFVVDSVLTGQRPEDGVLVLSCATCQLRVVAHEGEVRLEWGKGGAWMDAFGLHHYLHHQLGRAGPVSVSVPGDELASQAATVERLVAELVAFFAEPGYAERAAALARYTEARRAAQRRR